jgi:hypothetical protein
MLQLVIALLQQKIHIFRNCNANVNGDPPVVAATAIKITKKGVHGYGTERLFLR